jgi:hypothetical protein
MRRGQIQLPSLDTYQEDNTLESNSHRSSSGMVNALEERKHHAASKIRQKLHIQNKSNTTSPHAPILANVDKEESDLRLIERRTSPEKPTVKDFLHDLTYTVKSKVSNQGNEQVAQNIAVKELPHGQEVDLINTHDAIGDATTEHNRGNAQQDEARMINARQSTLVRWSLDHHFTNVHLFLREMMVRKPRQDFLRKNTQGEVVMNRKGHVQHVSP